jgi:biopolymer transport protein ExbB
MYPLLFFSIISLGIIIERFYRFYSVPIEKKANSILDHLQSLLQQYGTVEPLIEWCDKNKGIFSYVFLQVLKRFNFLVVEKRPILDMRNELLDTGNESAEEYFEEFLPIVNTIASVATLLGLLGTILGMIMSFDEIAKGGKGDPAVVAGGISVALITTAGGLIVAIPSVIGYSFLKRRTMKLVKYIEPFTNHFVNLILKDLARFATYREMLKTAYRDGVLNKEEEAFLKEKRIELNISDNEGRKLEDEILISLGYK